MLALCWLTIEAAPVHPGKRTAKLSDGTQVTLSIRGDEHISFYTDDKGQAYQINANAAAEKLRSSEELQRIAAPLFRRR